MSDFGSGNLPWGVFSTAEGVRRVGVRLEDTVVDLSDVDEVFRHPSLNPLMARGRTQWTHWRAVARANLDRPRIPLTSVRLHLPFDVADYTDFYSSEHHAMNAAKILRPGQPPLRPNWRHLPVGYHGRSSTVVVSGTSIVRPHGQIGAGGFGPTRKLDIEAEVGFVVGTPGSRIPTGDLAEHVFGVVLVNDWSARDFQAWEALPLGPFTAKSFATSISPWVVPLEALAPMEPPVQDPEPLDYLRPPGPAYDIELAVDVNGSRVSTPPFRHMYWTAAQQLAHLTVNGATVRTGDLYASGTVSGPAPDEAGSLLELTADGTLGGYLEDGDTVTISGRAPGAEGGFVGFGEVYGTVVG